jgi:nuclear transport factor 2 (NTF2) superfamily protein
MDPPGFTREEARHLVQRAEDSFNRSDVDAILVRYADDVVIRFAGMPEIRGKNAAEDFLRARVARQQGYRLKKTLRMVDGFDIGATYTVSWDDAQTGKHMLGYGAEFWRYDGGKLALWECALNIWEAGADPSAIFL